MSEPRLHGPDTIASAPFGDDAAGRFARGWLVPFVRDGVRPFLDCDGSVRVVELDGQLIPLSVADGSYLSTHARYIRLPRQALGQLGWHPAKAALAGAALDGVGRLLLAAGIDRNVYIGAWPLLRGWEPELDAAQAERLTRFLAKQYPRHALVWSASPITHAPLLNALAAAGYSFLYGGHTRILLPHPVPARQQRENRRRDARLLEESGYEIVGPEAWLDAEGANGESQGGEDALAARRAALAERLEALYRALNREKYSTNPAITAAFFAGALAAGTLTFRLALRDGRVDGFYAYAIRQCVLYPVAFGYDMAIPQEVGLYRMLVYRLVQDALDRSIAIETGAGADEFKSLRGDRPVVRYGAVYTAHLRRHRRVAWSALGAYANGSYRAAARAFLRRIDGEAIAGFDSVPTVFTTPPDNPSAAAAALRRELDAIERAIEEAAVSGDTEGGLDAERQLAMVSDRLNNWPQPTRLVEPLKARLAEVERRRLRARKRAGAEGLAASLAAAQALLDDSAGAEVALVVGALGAANRAQLQAAAAAVLEQRASAAAVFFAATHEQRAILVAALTRDLCDRGLNAVALISAIAPIVGGKGGGRPEIAFGGGDRLDAIPEAIQAARRYLQGRLVAS